VTELFTVLVRYSSFVLALSSSASRSSRFRLVYIIDIVIRQRRMATPTIMPNIMLVRLAGPCGPGMFAGASTAAPVAEFSRG
jgi:hypothetical protein